MYEVGKGKAPEGLVVIHEALQPVVLGQSLKESEAEKRVRAGRCSKECLALQRVVAEECLGMSCW